MTGIRTSVDDLGRDVRRAIRGLGRAPVFATTVTLILALGIGATTAMFSIVYGLLLRPLPYPDADTIVSIGQPSSLLGNLPGMFISNRSMDLLLENAESFEHLAVYQELSRAVGSGGSLNGASVSPAMFPLLQVSPHLGRPFLEEEALTGAGQVVLLSHRIWMNNFAADPLVVAVDPVHVDFQHAGRLDQFQPCQQPLHAPDRRVRRARLDPVQGRVRLVVVHGDQRIKTFAHRRRQALGHALRQQRPGLVSGRPYRAAQRERARRGARRAPAPAARRSARAATPRPR